MTIEEFALQVDRWCKDKVAFLFAVDFEFQSPFVCLPEEAAARGILYSIGGNSNSSAIHPEGGVSLTKFPITYSEYTRKFERVAAGLRYGDSFLTNLTIKTEIQCDRGLRELYRVARAPYKLLFGEEFLVFSPEPFIRIEDGVIRTFPMKGTINASIPNAKEIILSDPKELAEHVTIVDLMRNDLSRVARNVKVSRFRFVEEVKTSDKNLLQVSSEIAGELPPDHDSKFGTILAQLLPAGSVSGAPKPKTLEIIREAEKEKRGYYTGVFGYFDGEVLDSAVMIRFIEQSGGRLFYRSGGGITTQSDPESEYREAIDKIYVPID